MDNKKVYMEKQERLARFAKALGHPARIAILQFWPNRNSAISEIFTKNYR